MDVPFIERVKIQSEILLPFYKRMCAEVGKERAQELLREAVRETSLKLGAQAAASSDGSSLDTIRGLWTAFQAGEALEIESLASDEKEFSVNVRGCKYAEYFKSIGEPEFGAMLTCEADPPVNEGIGDDLGMERTQTIMRGASHCDFRYKLR